MLKIMPIYHLKGGHIIYPITVSNQSAICQKSREILGQCSGTIFFKIQLERDGVPNVNKILDLPIVWWRLIVFSKICQELKRFDKQTVFSIKIQASFYNQTSLKNNVWCKWDEFFYSKGPFSASLHLIYHILLIQSIFMVEQKNHATD